MYNRVKNTLKQWNLQGQEITVALSGGADSVCLLHILCELKDQLGFTVSAFHLNHNIRGEEAERDEVFVRKLCESQGISLTVKTVDIPSLSKQRGESTELCARKERYKAFEDFSLVATAHTASDNLETVLFNLARGSGIKGLAGIPCKRDNIIRPLISCTREEIEEYLNEREISFVTDSTNLSDEYNRNFIRHNIVPLLKKINPSVETTVSNNGEQIREDSEFLEGMASKIYAIIANENQLDADLLREQHPAIIKRVQRTLYKEVLKEEADRVHIISMYDALMKEGRASLPDGFSAECRGKTFLIEKKQDQEVKYDVEVLYGKIDDNVYNLLLKNIIDCDKIKGKLIVRTREEGDKFRPAGRNGTKTLKKLFNELKIPDTLRSALPVVADDEGVVWIYTVGAAERVKVDRNTENTVTFSINKI